MGFNNYIFQPDKCGRRLRDVVRKVLDCGIEVTEFELQLRPYVTFLH